jgi:drug/metabolite transporter (DMT)-like permease
VVDRGALGALFATTIIWATAFVAIKIGLEDYSPGALALLRYLSASAALAVWAALRGTRLPPRSQLWRLLGLGVVGISAYHVALNIGEQLVSAGTAALIVAAAPAMTAALSAWLIGERLPLLRWTGIAIAFAGVALVIVGQGGAVEFTVAASVVAIAPLTWALYAILARPLILEHGAVAVTTWSAWAGTLPLLIFLPELVRDLPGAAAATTGAGLYMGLFPSAVAYSLATFAIGRLGASISNAFLYLIPLFATLFGFLVQGEVPPPGALLGGAVIIAGVLLVNWPRR